MTMEHRAFAFDFEAFVDELANPLLSALASGDIESLVKFIELNLAELKDPYEGNSLDASWREMIEFADAHQYGDFALTKFYDPANDIGLGTGWAVIEDLLNATIDHGEVIILGKPFGPTSNYFDPGKLGSYFQSAGDVRAHLKLIEELIQRRPELAVKLDDTAKMFTKPVQRGKGLYITF